MLTDEAIENYADIPTKAIVAPLEINPQIIMWDPATYPDVQTIADLGRKNVTIRYFETGAYMRYLVNSGQVKQGQLDGSYDGSPAVFTAQGGKIAQQGFASSEPYTYEHLVPEWGKPVTYQLIHDAGWTAVRRAAGRRAGQVRRAQGVLRASSSRSCSRPRSTTSTSPDKADALIVEAVHGVQGLLGLQRRAGQVLGEDAARPGPRRATGPTTRSATSTRPG